MTYDIHDADGNRIGVMTATGPILSASEEEVLTAEEAVRSVREAQRALRDLAVAKDRRRRMERLKEVAEINPRYMIDRLDQLTFEERKLVLYALQGGDSVNLPYAVSCVLKTKEKEGHTKHAVEVSLRRAASRLYNRGLATVAKRGTAWFGSRSPARGSSTRYAASSPRGGPRTRVTLT